MVRLPHLHGEPPRVEPHQPHEFREINDAGLGTGLGGMTGRGATNLNMIAMTDNYLRKSVCGVPGCGKDRGDPIHEAAE